MAAVTVSKDFRIVIPKDVRTSLSILPGQRVEVVAKEGRAELIPLRSPESSRGFLRGIDTRVPRDEDRT